LLQLLKPLLSSRKPTRTVRQAGELPLAPDQPVYAIGDIHGRDDLVEPLLIKIDADITERGIEAPQLVFLGDYVDRGDQSAGVLEHLYKLTQDLPDVVTCLMGNHEKMMLEFLDDPAGRGARWLANGGLQTLASYNIGGLSTRASIEDMAEASDALAEALPVGMEAWLRALPLIWQSGNVVCVHAAMNPSKPPEDQDERGLIWGHRDFLQMSRPDDLWVVHGHTTVDMPLAADSRISIDTGAWHSDRLTAAAITAGECRFL